MPKLTKESLDFAKDHIEKFYDSDFFPKPFEYEALWHCWDEIVIELTSRNVTKLPIKPPLTLSSTKPDGTYRIVHQLDPINSIIYTALAYQIASAVEKKRSPLDEKIACSYRIDVHNGSFFSAGTGYLNYTEQSELLTEKYSHVLITDISDFYNQIYLHRLNNGIEYCDSELKTVGDDIEKFISTMNSHASKGIPVGPAASIIMAETTLIDIDEFLENLGVTHTRYVDDFRIFSNSEEKLRDVLQELTLYLYHTHRLSLNGSKTNILQSTDYKEEILHNHYELEKVEIFKSLPIPDTSTGDIDDFEIEYIEYEEQIARCELILKKILERKKLDLGLARFLIRKAKRHRISGVADKVLDNFDFFSPIINDVCLLLNEVTDECFLAINKQSLINLVQSSTAKLPLNRLWLEWYFTQHTLLTDIREVRSYIKNGSNIVSHAALAISRNEISWVRSAKGKIYNVGDRERRAIIHAAKILPTDERKHWLKLVQSNPDIVDRCVSKWLLAGIPTKSHLKKNLKAPALVNPDF